MCPRNLSPLAAEGIRANGRSADIIETLLQAAFPEFFPESEPPQACNEGSTWQYIRLQILCAGVPVEIMLVNFSLFLN